MICNGDCYEALSEDLSCQIFEEEPCSGIDFDCCTLDLDAMRACRAACKIAADPQLLLKKIDAVQRLGIVGERRNIGICQLVIDSRLLPIMGRGPETLALKNSGHQGAGKSATLSCSLKLYSSTAYHMISSGSAKSFYYMGDCLSYKAIILAEGHDLECRKGQDTPFIYSLRTLYSEGQVTYQVTVTNGRQRKTVTETIYGPISLITTTIREKLEEQMDDRMITIHPNISSEQTSRIIRQVFSAASGNTIQVDSNQIAAWRMFHDMLEPIEVFVPFADVIGEQMAMIPNLPPSARRGSRRILSAIKTIAVLYQNQRQRDEQGRLIAEMADYAMAHQLLEVPFVESLGETSRFTDERIQFVAAKGVATQRMISEAFNISRPAVSKWLTPLVEKGVLVWCDAQGRPFADERTAKNAKHSGIACLKVTTQRTLPTPFEVSGDPSWAEGGDLFKLYDLHLDDADYHINQANTLGVNLLTENPDDAEVILMQTEEAH